MNKQQVGVVSGTAAQAHDVLVPGIEVLEATASDWLMATVGAKNEVPHSRGEKVVQLKAAVPIEWSLS